MKNSEIRNQFMSAGYQLLVLSMLTLLGGLGFVLTLPDEEAFSEISRGNTAIILAIIAVDIFFIALTLINMGKVKNQTIMENLGIKKLEKKMRLLNIVGILMLVVGILFLAALFYSYLEPDSYIILSNFERIVLWIVSPSFLVAFFLFEWWQNEIFKICFYIKNGYPVYKRK